MSSDQENYRPRSPDLSAFAPPPPPFPSRPQRLPSVHHDSGFPTGHSPYQHRGSYDASPYFSPATTTPSVSYFSSQPNAETSPPAQLPQLIAQQEPFTPRAVQPILPGFRRTGSDPQASPSNQPPLHYSQSNTAPSLNMPRPRRRKSSAEDDSEDPSYAPDSLGQSRTSRKRKSDLSSIGDQAPASFKPSGSLHGIDVKTKFPVARIKRIMQADEDVGKVAQATPTAVSKALELFMIQLVLKGTTEARAKNSKKVSALHLKSALMKDGQFDFLEAICEKVQEPTDKKAQGPQRAKSEDSLSADEGGRGGGGGKKGKGRSRRKLEDDSD